MAVLYPVTRERTWYSRGNVPLPDNSTADLVRKSHYFVLKNLLIGAETGGTTDSTRPASTYWTVVSSSDGATSGASDLWGTTFDASKLLFSGANKSWIILQSPAALGPLYCLLHLGNASGSGHFSLSTSAPTGGNATTYPTITANSMGWESYGAGGYTTSGAFLTGLTDVNTTAHLAHFAVNTLGGFHYALSRTAAATGRFHFYGMVDKATDTQTSDVFPYWCATDSQSAGTNNRGAPQQSSLVSSSRAYDGTYVSGAVGGLMSFKYEPSNTRVEAALPDNIATVHLALPGLLMRANTSTAAGNAWSGRMPDLHQIAEGSSGSPVNIGASVPNSSSPLYHVVGNFLVPFGVVPTLAGGSKGNASFSVPKLTNTQYPTATPPTVSVVSPALGNISATDSLVFDVTDSDGFTELVVAVSFANGDYEIAHDGTSFSSKYSTNSTRAAISNGYRYTLKRFNNWHSSPTVKVFPVDTLGAGSS